MAHDHHRRLDNEAVALRAMLITAGYMLAELVGGVLSGSLALLADAAHMLTDAGALALTWAAFRMARRPPDALRSYGYDRLQVLAAFVNAAVLLAIVGWIGVEAVLRLGAPVPIEGRLMLAVAVGGLAVNVLVLWMLRRGEPHNLNLEGAALHVLGDVLGSLAAIVAAAVVLTTGWTPIDPLLSLVVAALIVRSAWPLLRRAGHILLEGAPEHIDIAGLPEELVAAVAPVVDVHHVHAWSLTDDRPMVTLHARVAEHCDLETAAAQIHDFLAQRYGPVHATVQVERGRCFDASSEGSAGATLSASRTTTQSARSLPDPPR